MFFPFPRNIGRRHAKRLCPTCTASGKGNWRFSQTTRCPLMSPTEERHIVVGQIDVHEQWHQGTTEFLPLDTRSRLSVWVDSDPSPNYQPPAASSSGGSEIDEIVKSGRYTPMPTAQRVGSSGSGLASIKVTNNTAYTLSLVYEGISSQTLTIPARNTATIQLPAGSFRVLGRVSAPGVLPFIGSEILGPGDSLVSRFFIK
jgi:hypothetical protein